MKNTFLILIISLSISSGYCQENIMQNQLTYEQIISHPDFKPIKNNPELDSNITLQFQTALQQYNILIFLGTWCSDSQELVPDFLNLLEQLHYPKEHLQIYGLNEAKASDEKIEQVYNIEFVPTFIFLDRATQEERYRIVEQFEEQDLLKSFSKALLQNK